MVKVRQVAMWIMRHKAAAAKLLLSLLALMIILFLPLRTVVVPANVNFGNSIGIYYYYPSTGLYHIQGVYNLSDLATESNGSLAVAVPAGDPGLGSTRWVYVELGVDAATFIKYGMSVEVCVQGADGVGIAAGPLPQAADAWTSSGCLNATYLDLVSHDDTEGSLWVIAQVGVNATTITVSVTTTKHARAPLYTALTEPIAAAFSAIWGAILGAIRRVRSIMNSALGGFWSYFGISAFTGNVILALATAALIVYLIHYRHIFKPRKR